MMDVTLTEALESLEHMGRETKIKVLGLLFIRPPAHIIDEFGISDEQLLCQMVRIRSNRNLPRSQVCLTRADSSIPSKGV